MTVPTMISKMPDAASILDKLLRTELAATARYEDALLHIERPDVQRAVGLNRASHLARAVALHQAVCAAGGKPSDRPGAWGTLTMLIEETAALVGERAVMETLHVGEKQVTNTYDAQMARLEAQGAVATAVTKSRQLQIDTEERMKNLLAA